MAGEDHPLRTVPDPGPFDEEAETLVDADGGDGEVGPPKPQGHGAHGQGQEDGKEGRQGKPDDDNSSSEALVGQVVDGDGHAVGAHTHEGHVAEIHVAGHAHEQVKGLPQGAVEGQLGNQLPLAGDHEAVAQKQSVSHEDRDNRQVFT